MYVIALALWIAFLVVAAFYTRQAKHPRARPLAAYMIFVIVFTVVSFLLYAAVILGLQALGRIDWLGHPAAAALFVLLVFVPAFFVARWQLRKPPSQQRP